MSLVAKIIWHVEMQLDHPMSLDDLSANCAVSPFHMARVFRGATGLSPMAYLRRRRLSRAAKALANGGQDILTIALDAQYGSHAAFTRAFVAQFGPSELRAMRSADNLNLLEPFKMNKETFVDVAPHKMAERPEFRVVGVGAQCTFENVTAIPVLWRQFNAREDELESIPGVAYGICCDADGEGGFRYLAGMAARPDALMPTGMQDVTVPAGAYAVFQHGGHISDMPKTVYTIWNKSLPESGLQLRPAPDFEVYDSRFNVETGRGVVEVWIPVAA